MKKYIKITILAVVTALFFVNFTGNSSKEKVFKPEKVNYLTYKVKPAPLMNLQESFSHGHYDHMILKNSKVNQDVFQNWPVNLPEEEVVIAKLQYRKNGGYLSTEDFVGYWKSKGLEPIPFAYAYLDQLMRNLPDRLMPEELKNVTIVAWTPDSEPKFEAFSGRTGFLCMERPLEVELGWNRALSVSYSYEWNYNFNYAFILRKIKA